MLRNIAIKLLLLTLAIAGLNLAYNFTLYDKDLAEKSKEVAEIRNTLPETDVYYFGESSNITYAPDDSVKNSISELTAFFYPGLKVVNINKYATHAGIYKCWLRSMDHLGAKPKAVIITLNLRSFDVTWINSKLETQLQESIVLTWPGPNIINRFFLSLQAFDNRSEKQREEEVREEWRTTELHFPFEFKYRTVKQWDDGMANGGHLKPDGTWDIPGIELACHYIKGFAFNLDENNPRVKDFDEIYDWCFENKISLYLNLMAENIEFADSLVGKELVFLMKQNRDYLVRRYTKSNCTVIDNLELVGGKEFIDTAWTSEHYVDNGRMRIAKNLAGAMSKEFKNYYKEAY